MQAYKLRFWKAGADLHPLAVSSNGLDSDFELIREEDEHLIRGIVVVRHQDDQVIARRLLLARLVAKLLPEKTFDTHGN